MVDFFEIKTLLDDTAKKLVKATPDTEKLHDWIVYFLEALETDIHNQRDYNEMLSDLIEDVEQRVESGKW
jgi:hypothetical protein